jgi:hypothetical protein
VYSTSTDGAVASGYSMVCVASARAVRARCEGACMQPAGAMHEP